MKGDDTINIVSTPNFPESPLEPAAPLKSKLCMRLFEDSSVSYLSDWTTDSVAEEPEREDEPENEFKWSSTP